MTVYRCAYCAEPLSDQLHAEIARLRGDASFFAELFATELSLDAK